MLFAAASLAAQDVQADALRHDLETGAALAKAHRYKNGLALARTLVARFPDSAPAHQMLGFFETKCQENIAAVASYRRALDLDPDSPGAAIGLGIAQSAAGMDQDARHTFEAAIARFPQNPIPYQALGTLLLKLSDAGQAQPAQAERMFAAALALDPTLAESHYQLGNLALARGDCPDALQHLQAAVRSRPQDSRVHFALARVYRRLGQQADAARETELFRRAKEAEAAAGVAQSSMGLQPQ